MSQPTYRVAVDPTMPGFWCVWSDRHHEPLATGLSLATAQVEVDALTERAAAGWTPEPEPTCRHCGAPDLAPWDAADAGMAGDYCARCVDDAVLGAPCPACGNVPGDDDPCPSR